MTTTYEQLIEALSPEDRRRFEQMSPEERATFLKSANPVEATDEQIAPLNYLVRGIRQDLNRMEEYLPLMSEEVAGQTIAELNKVAAIFLKLNEAYARRAYPRNAYPRHA